jgi:hypothetical protein
MKHLSKITVVKAASIGDSLEEIWNDILSFFKKDS